MENTHFYSYFSFNKFVFLSNLQSINKLIIFSSIIISPLYRNIYTTSKLIYFGLIKKKLFGNVINIQVSEGKSEFLTYQVLTHVLIIDFWKREKWSNC